MSTTALPDTAIRSSSLRVAAPDRPTTLLESLFREQQTLTAVERFAQKHEACEVPAQARYYRDLIPLERPKPGQQYAFEVDLDACTGCKACVAACHSLNGLDEEEVWRTVGLLHGGTAAAPAQQTVTTSCHHCVDPACMSGCPVGAYEKDPVTGIVRHLDDQCIGCQYCTLMCPYDAPKYSKSKGIVRKCDMCTDRLSGGEAPACVQGCPNQAIRIKVVDQVSALQASDANTFLPGAPAPDHTVPTTVYKSAKPAAPNMLPADYYGVSPEHGHLPLVIMLVLTQLSVGAFALTYLVRLLFGLPTSGTWGVSQAVLALVLGGAAIAASTLHLGRPLYAWRAVLGVRTSWLSREALAFAFFAKAGGLYALSLVPHLLPDFPGKSLLVALRSGFELAAVGIGLLGVACSVMVYAATRRAHWRGALTGPRFFATTVLLGAATVHAVSLFAAGSLGGLAGDGGVGLAKALLVLVMVVGGAKLLVEASVLRHLNVRRHTVMKRVALVMTRDLERPTLARFLFGGVGSVVIPGLALSVLPASVAGTGFSPGLRAAAVASLLLLLAGELLERYLFFKAAPASRMPGGLS
jgi:Fe-S-cluster-containing dehydrogenase component/DMSO reductase anchor subunit